MNVEDEVKNLEEHMEIRLNELNEKVDSSNKMVGEIHVALVGNQYNKEESLIAKVARLESKVRDLEIDKVKRDAKMTIIIAAVGIAAAIMGSILSAYIQTIFNTKK